MSNQMIIRIDPEIKDRLNSLARIEGKTTSQIVRELIENYLKERDIGTYIDDLWDRVGGKLISKGANLSDIEMVIKNVREKKG